MRRVPLRTLATAVLFGIPLAACSDNAPGEQLGSSSEAINPILGCDYSFARPSPSSLTSMGYKFAARYLSGDPGGGKDISASEAKSLTGAGMDVVLVWEADGNAALSGYNQGVSDAKAAKSEADSVGQPSSRPIYFAVDFEADSGSIGSVTSYFEGVASVLGLSRTGAYGGYYTIQQLFNGKKISFGWQTYAWSDGSWDSRAQLRQTQNGVDNDQLDADQGMVADYGQWPIAAAESGDSCTNPDTNASEPSGTCIASGEFGNLYCDNGTWNPSSCAPGAPNAPTSSGVTGIADDVLNDFLWNADNLPGTKDHGFFKKVGSDGGYFRDGNGYWGNAQMFDAVIDGVNRTDGRYYLGLIERMSHAAEEAQGGWLEPDYNRVYFNDLAQMSITLMRAYDAMQKYDSAHAGAYLTNADNIFKAVVKYAPDHIGKQQEFEGLWYTMTPRINPDLSVGTPTGTGSSSGRNNIVKIASANVDKHACSENSAGGRGFESSCTGYLGGPEFWCSDFAMWVWAQAGIDTSALNAGAVSFYEYGQDHGTLHSTPALGDAVVFGYSPHGGYENGPFADHVAIVTQVNSNGTIETVSGDWGGRGAGENQFSSTSSVTLNTPAYSSADGTTPQIMGMPISGFISPVGFTTAPPSGPTPISYETPDKLLEKNTVSNFTPVIAAARLAQRLEKGEADFYADWAKQVYQFWRAIAVETQNDGSLFVKDAIQGGEWTAQSYTIDQGVGIGAALELARMTAKTNTHESAQYLADAHRMADYLVTYEVINVSGLGPILSDGGDKPFSGVDSKGNGTVMDDHKGIAYRYLMELYNYDTSLPASQRSPEYSTYSSVLHASYEGILTLARDTKVHEIGFRWDLPVSKQEKGTFISQSSNASAVMAVELFAETFPSE